MIEIKYKFYENEEAFRPDVYKFDLTQHNDKLKDCLKSAMERDDLDSIIDIAKECGIEVDGKTKEQIIAGIIKDGDLDYVSDQYDDAVNDYFYTMAQDEYYNEVRYNRYD